MGRLFLFKGSTPPKLTSLEVNLISTLKIQEGLKISSLGKGFYALKFSSLEEKFKILSKSSCKLSFGLFKLFSWKLDFSPSRKFTFTHVWVRFYALPLEYWHPQILFSIANVIGVPIKISKYTLGKTFGFYAKVLVEVDVSCPLPSKIFIERDSFSFVLNISYENLTSWCKHCGNLGHEISVCKNLTKLYSNGSPKAQPFVQSATMAGGRQLLSDVTVETVVEEIDCGVAIDGGTASSSSLVTAIPASQVAAMTSSRQPPIIDDGLVADIAKYHATGELFAAVESNLKDRCSPRGVCIDKFIDGEGQQPTVPVADAAAVSPASSCNNTQVIPALPANISPVQISRCCSVHSAQLACSVGTNPRASLSFQTTSQLDYITLVECQFVGPCLEKEIHNFSPRGSKLRSGHGIPFLFNWPKKFIFTSLIGPCFKSICKAHSGQNFCHWNKMLGPSKIMPSFSPLFSHNGLGSSLGHSSFSQIFSSSNFNSEPSKTFSTQLGFSKIAPSSCLDSGAPLALRTRPNTKKILKPGFYFRKKSSFKDFLLDTSFNDVDFSDDDFLEDLLSLESPIKTNSNGFNFNYVNFTPSEIFYQDSSTPLSKKSELSSNTKRKRKRRNKPGSDCRARVWWKKVKECRKDVNQVYSLFKVGHIFEIEAKLMLRPTFAFLNFLSASPIDDT